MLPNPKGVWMEISDIKNLLTWLLDNDRGDVIFKKIKILDEVLK